MRHVPRARRVPRASRHASADKQVAAETAKRRTHAPDVRPTDKTRQLPEMRSGRSCCGTNRNRGCLERACCGPCCSAGRFSVATLMVSQDQVSLRLDNKKAAPSLIWINARGFHTKGTGPEVLLRKGPWLRPYRYTISTGAKPPPGVRKLVVWP